MCNKKIIYIGGFELPDGNAAAHRVISNGKIFKALGFEVQYIGVRKELDKIEQCQECSGFRTWSTPYPGSLLAWMFHITGAGRQARRLLKQLDANTTAVILYNYPAVAQLLIMAICRFMGVKVISDCTEWYDSGVGSILFRNIKRLDTWLRMQFVNNHVDGLITTSKFITDMYFGRGKKVVELPTLYDCASYVLSKQIHNNAVRSYIYVGNPFPTGRKIRQDGSIKERLDRCISLFYKAFSQGEKFRFDVVGVTLAEYLNAFPMHASMIDEMQEWVTFHGRVPNKSAVEMIKKSDFSVFFRDATRVTLSGFPSKLAESVTLGVPVLANRMISIERYSNRPCLCLAAPGHEYDALLQTLKLNDIELTHLKNDARAYRAFQYETYVEDVRHFITKVGGLDA